MPFPTILTFPLQQSLSAIPADESHAATAVPYRSHWNDRAAATAVAVAQIMMTAPCEERQQLIEQYLREEFADEQRQAVADRELVDA